MIDHIGIATGKFVEARRFYDGALSALGLSPLMEVTPQESGGYHGIGYGRDGKPVFWLSNLPGAPQGAAVSGQGLHIAFAAENRPSVDAFFAAAMAHGGADNGGPGLRPDYHPNYYAAFVLDPDGRNIEAVCHTPPGPSAR